MTDSAIAVEGLSLTLGAFALRDVSLEVAAGEILVLLGPNGAGKSVIVETIAGFHRPRTGRIVISGRDATRLPPERRSVGLVFQNFSLFPHLSVVQNVAIGVRRDTKPTHDDMAVPLGNVPALLHYFSIAHLADRKPRDLSAGERQRASLARAFATRPDLLLFDEPFSALDAVTREQLRPDLGRIVRDAGIPTIFVTHDPIDARVLADRIAVINQGMVIQQGAAAEIFERPRDAFVAAFVGVENMLTGHVEGGSGDYARVVVADRIIHSRRSPDDWNGRRVVVCIRAENVKLHLGEPGSTNQTAGSNRLPGRIATVTNLGPLTKVIVDCGFALAAYVMSGEIRAGGFVPDAAVEAAIDAGAVHLALEA